MRFNINDLTILRISISDFVKATHAQSAGRQTGMNKNARKTERREKEKNGIKWNENW